MKRAVKNLTVAASLVLTGAMFVGCSQTSVGSIRRNPTPGIDGLYRSTDQKSNAWAIYADTTLRMLNDDIDRALYIDRPNRLTPAPIPY